MSDEERDSSPSPEEPSARDSRLEAFLRQASAIIAGEKGLTNAAKARLDELATKLHLPDELFQQGLEQLQDSNAPIGDLTAYEKGFLKFLSREFSKMPESSVLTISMEDQAVAIASDKFQLTPDRAEQLIDFQSRAFRFGRLSREEAKQYGRQMMLDCIGDAVEIEPETKKRIDRLGRHWGVAVVDIDELTLQALTSNRRQAGRASTGLRAIRWRVAIVVLAAVLIVSVAGYGWWQTNRSPDLNPQPADDVGIVDTTKPQHGTAFPTNAAEPPVMAEPPAMAELQRLFPDFSTRLAATDEVARATAFQDLVHVSLQRNLSPDQSQALAEFYLRTPSIAVAQRLERELDAALSVATQELSASRLATPYRASDIAIAVCGPSKRVLTSEMRTRQSRIAAAVSNRIGVDLAVADLSLRNDALASAIKTTVGAAIARSQWNRLIQSGWSSPSRSAVLVQPLFELTESRLDADTLNLLLQRSVRTILQSDPSLWSEIKTPLRRTIAASDEIQTVQWIETYFQKYNATSAFRRFTAPLLATRIESNPALPTDEISAQLQRFRNDYRNLLLRPALVRHAKIEALIVRLQERLSVDDPETSDAADLIFQAVAAGNLCLEMNSLADAGRAGDESAYVEIDAQLKRSELRLRDFVFLDDPAAAERDVLPASGFDTTARDRAFESLADLSDENRATRKNSVAQLAKLALKFDSVPQSQATTLANYLLSPIERSEWLDVQRSVPRFATWQRVLLAVSDQLPDSQAPLDQTLTMLNLLTGKRYEIAQPTAWRQELAWQVFVDSRQLFSSHAIGSDLGSAGSDWIRLRKYLQTALRRRAELLGASVKPADRSPWSLSQAYLKAVDDNEKVHRAIELVGRSTKNEILRVAIANRLLLQFLPESGDALSKDALSKGGAFSKGQASQAKTTGLQLLDSEAALLQRFNSQRKKVLTGMVDEQAIE